MCLTVYYCEKEQMAYKQVIAIKDTELKHEAGPFFLISFSTIIRFLILPHHPKMSISEPCSIILNPKL